PLDPNLDIYVSISVNTTLWAKKPDRPTLYRGEVKSFGESYVVGNSSSVQWTSYYYVSVPPGYSDLFYFNVTKPTSRTITFVSSPTYPTVDFGYWSTGPNHLNVSAYLNTTEATQSGFWSIKGTSPNLVTALTMSSGGSWTSTGTFRANDNLQFQASTPQLGDGATVRFRLYNTEGVLYTSLQATVISGSATTASIELDPNLFETGQWTVQAIANDSISGSPVHNIGFFSRPFAIRHATEMYVIYPQEARTTWTKNTTLGQQFLLQVRVNDSDNGDLLPGGVAYYNWTTGQELLSDQTTGEYNTYLNTADLGVRGRHVLVITWNLNYYDPITKMFILNIVEETTLRSPDAPEVSTPRGWNATFELIFEDSLLAGIDGAAILCNWTDSPYYVEPVGGSPGSYILTITTDNSILGTYPIIVEARANYYVTSKILLYVNVRQLLTSVTLSKSYLTLPSGFLISVNLTYWDTDHNLPMLGAESLITCNWSESHVSGDQNYTVGMVAPGKYLITLYGTDADLIKVYNVIFQVNRFATRNHTLSIPLSVVTRLTSFSPDNSVDPTPYSGYVNILVNYYDQTAGIGIANNSANGHNVFIYVTTAGIDPLIFTVQNGTSDGHYSVRIPANQWSDISGWKTVTVFVNWTGDVAKYQNLSISVNFRLTQSPTDLFIGANPVSTPYGNNISFSIIYWDVAGNIGITNATGPYAGNVSIHIQVLTAGETITQSDMVIIELGGGEYLIEFNTSLLSGLISLELRIYANWTYGALPLYENSTLTISVISIYRQTLVQWNPLPTTPYDGPVNLTFSYIDVIRASAITNDSKLSISILEDGVMLSIFYNPSTRVFTIAINTTYWGNIGTYSFHLSILWSGSPYYQNRTSTEISISIRARNTDLSHLSVPRIEYGENVTIVFTYTDLDDQTTAGMLGADLALDPSLSGYYSVIDNLDGNYTLTLNSTAFGRLGTFLVNVIISYNGIRFCIDATDFFYLRLIARNTLLTGDQIDAVPFLSLANLTVQYTDDISLLGINGASIQASCAEASQSLVLGVNYWVLQLGSGQYEIRIDTQALGSFQEYDILISVTWTGSPFYTNRSITIPVEVIRRDASIRVTTSPLSTPFLEIFTFEITVEDQINGQGISLTKSELILTHGSGTLIPSGSYTLAGADGVYWISINTTTITGIPRINYPINIDFFWGDTSPFYSNASTFTRVSITYRYTQASILSTPPAYYSFNTSVIVSFSDYLTGAPIIGAHVTFVCENQTSVQGVALDNGDGTYTIRTNT
ncbi:MAG: hypothetical protein ACFFCX_17140, partial [Candidatus Sifarchaeia archaeon]